MIMPFGKYNEWELKDIPSSYLKWFYENIDPVSERITDLIEACRLEYERREDEDDHFEDYE